MTHVSYRVIYQPLAEGGYMASVPALPDLQVFGATMESAKAGISQALADSVAAYGDLLPPDFPGDPVVEVIAVPLQN
ncbi:MAG TPA: type II toxin-antitoxin system HicB family antitoxin [bacterium]|nr:type II toxin-antitoxin system HicB family antitoxin [bacterium]